MRLFRPIEVREVSDKYLDVISLYSREIRWFEVCHSSERAAEQLQNRSVLRFSLSGQQSPENGALIFAARYCISIVSQVLGRRCSLCKHEHRGFWIETAPVERLFYQT